MDKVGIYTRAHACVYVCVPWYLDLLLTCGRETTARSFPPVSSSVSILADLLFICPLFSCDVAVYHPSGAVSDNTAGTACVVVCRKTGGKSRH